MRQGWCAAGMALVAVLSACQPATTGGPARQRPITSPVVDAGQIPPYERDHFGRGWPRVRGSCDLKEIILERDAIPPAVDADGDGCRDDGPVLDPYTGETVPAAEAEPDHVMALEDAWSSGAFRWTPVQQRIFYSDTANLRMVRNRVNESKGSRGPDQWRPPRVGWCAYSMTYAETAARWQIQLTEAKRAALVDMSRGCAVKAGR